MKLIFCPTCSDIVRLIEVRRYCQCSRSYGQYLKDGLHAQIGGEAIPLGFSNPSLLKALEERPEEGMGINFDAFVIPRQCDTVVKI